MASSLHRLQLDQGPRSNRTRPRPRRPIGRGHNDECAPRRTVQPPCEESPASLRLGQLSEAGPKQGQQQRGLAPLERFERPGRSQHRRSSQPASAAIPGGSSRPEPGPPHIGRRRLHGEARSPGRPIPSRGHTARRSLTRSSSTSHRRSQRPGGGPAAFVACTNHEQKHRKLCSWPRSVACQVRRPHQAVDASRPADPEPAKNPIFPLNLWAVAGQGQSRQRLSRGTSRQCESLGRRRRRIASSRLVRPMGLLFARFATCRASTGFASPSASLSRLVACSRQTCTPGPFDRV